MDPSPAEAAAILSESLGELRHIDDSINRLSDWSERSFDALQHLAESIRDAFQSATPSTDQKSPQGEQWHEGTKPPDVRNMLSKAGGAEGAGEAAEGAELAEGAAAGGPIGAGLVGAWEAVKGALSGIEKTFHALDGAAQDLLQSNSLKGLGKAFTDYVPVVGKAAGAALSFAGTMEMANKALAEFSPSMAGVLAESQARHMLREMNIGEGTAGSAKRLADASNELQDDAAPIRKLGSNLGNLIAAGATKVLDILVKPLGRLADIGDEGVKRLASIDDKDKGSIGLGQWMADVADEAEADRRRGRQAMGDMGAPGGVAAGGRAIGGVAGLIGG